MRARRLRDGGPKTADSEAVKEEIAREIARVHEESYGEAATNLEVGLHENFIAIVKDVAMSRSEQTLLAAGYDDSVTG